jgi:DNA-binding phage protein
MRDRIPIDKVTWAPRYLCEGLDCEEAISGYMEAAAEEGGSWFLESMVTVGRARLINQLTASTGIDRLRLCAALDGGPALDDGDIPKILEHFAVRASHEVPVAVG